MAAGEDAARPGLSPRLPPPRVRQGGSPDRLRFRQRPAGGRQGAAGTTSLFPLLPPPQPPAGWGFASARPLRRCPRPWAVELGSPGRSPPAPQGPLQESSLRGKDCQGKRLRFIPRPGKHIAARQWSRRPRLRPSRLVLAGCGGASSRGDDGASFF